MSTGFSHIESKQEFAVLIGVITSQQTEEMAKEYIEELAFLAETSGAETKRKFSQRMVRPTSKTYIGSSKIKEIEELIAATEFDSPIFDDELYYSSMYFSFF